MSGDGTKAYVGNGAGDGDIKATTDTDGTILFGGLGDDILRGGRYDDILNGGGGDDQYFGSLGLDQFRFFGSMIDGDSDFDRLYDLDFSQGDMIVLADFGVGSFSDNAGVQSFGNGDDARITSFEGLANLVRDSASVSATRYGNTESIILTILDADGQTQTIQISNAYTGFITAGGEFGI